MKHSENRNSLSDYASKNATFNLVKKLILFPEVLKFFYLTENLPDMMKYAQAYARLECSQNLSLHIVYT